jgi:hypothetical protein
MTCVSLYNIKQRSHPHHPTPDRLFPEQTAIAPQTQNPIAYSLKSTSDRPSPPTKPDLLNLQINQRSPLITTNPIAYSLKSNSDRPSSTKTRS